VNVTALAVIIDSAVTVGVGWRLNRTAKKEVGKAVKEIEPAIRASVEQIAVEFQQKTKQQMVTVINKMLPLILREVKKSRSEPNISSEFRETNIQTPPVHSDLP
jgi:ribosome maturation protein Sdo1